jgi:hypothetical protein
VVVGVGPIASAFVFVLGTCPADRSLSYGTVSGRILGMSREGVVCTDQNSASSSSDMSDRRN